MALSPIRIPTRNQAQPIVDDQNRATTEFHRWLNDILGQLVVAFNALAALPQIQQALADLDAATQAALDAAATAQQTTDATKREAALQGSYIDPDSVLTATTTIITIAAHTRRYADGTSVAVNAGTVAATSAGDTDYVSYSDPNRTGGTVTYIASTTSPAQTGNTHVVGAVTIPATGSASGGRGPRKPGYVAPDD